MSYVLETKDLRKVFGNKSRSYTALDGIDLQVEKGEFLGVMGPSGAGKTTLLNILSTIDMPTSGEVFLDGEEIGKMKNKELAIFRRNKLGFIFQDFNLLDNMKVEDNIALPLALSKKNCQEIEKKLIDLSSFFGIEDQLKKYPYQLSGGQKQRVAAARALITSPAVVFADEPTGALDSKSSTELLKSLTRMNEEFNSTIVMVTHDSYAASFCKRILFIKDGKIHAKLNKNESRKDFFQRILESQAALGGVNHEFI